MSHKAIVLDANILIRAVLGKRVRELIFEHATTVKFFAPDVAYADARKYLPALLEKRGVTSGAAMAVLDSLAETLHNSRLCVLDPESVSSSQMSHISSIKSMAYM